MNTRAFLSGLRSIPLLHYLLLPLGIALLLRYRWLMDDAYVYFRYADNAVIYGSGLVYNAGEFVEGYSSPGWMLLLAACRYFTGNYHLIVYGLGMASFVLFWAALLALNRALVPSGAPYHNLPAIYLVGNYAVQCYFTSGLESPLVQLTAVVYAAAVFLPHKRWLHLSMALAPMVRPEFALPVGILLLWITAHRWRDGLFLLAAILTLNLGWLAFRIYYYADLFPNTFHLKDEANVLQGLKYLRDTAEPYLLIPYLIVMAVMLGISVHADRRSPANRLGARLVILLAAASVTAYVVRIGGDPRHYRYLAFPFCAAVAATCGISEHFATGAHRHLRPELADTLRKHASRLVVLGGVLVLLYVLLQAMVHALSPWAPMAIGLAIYFVIVDLLSLTSPRRRVLLPLFLVFVLSRYPWQLAQNPLIGPSVHLQIDLINDAAYHRTHDVFDWKHRSLLNEARPPLKKWDDYNGLLISGICAQHFMHADYWGVHTYGLTEPFLSRVNMPSDRPAHKEGLRPLAFDLHEVYTRIPPGRGTFRSAVERNLAPAWVADNLEALEDLELRVYNDHDFLENLRLALSPSPRITPPPTPEEPTDELPELALLP